MRTIVLISALLALAVAAIGTAPTATPALGADRPANRGAATLPTKPSATWDDYRLIVDRNIFLRDRTRPSAPRPSYTPRPSRSPDPEMVLCGVADQDGGLVAFFEDDQTGQTTRLGVGQRIRGGSIVGVTLDGVDYQTSSGTRRVAIGQTLSGAAANLGATSSPSTAPSPAAASGDSPAPGASAASGAGDKAVDDIVERMKKRRLAELNAAEAASTSKPATQDSKNDGANTSSTPGGAPSDSAPAGSTSSPSSPSSTGSIEQ